MLDELDRRIIRLLQRNARVPNTEIGRALDVTETTIRNRVSRLLDEKLIEIVAVVDPKATERMYEITVAEHPHYKIPYLGFRGSPLGIDVFKVLATGIQPVIDGGLAGRGGGQIGAGILRAPLDCFTAAGAAWTARYGE